MPKKKPAGPPPSTAPTNFSSAIDNLDFDSIEEKIRGEEILVEGETRRAREAHDVKKKLDQAEINRRMEELKKKIDRKK